MADVRRPVVVYRETLLAPSEPFITAQGEALRRHEAWYLGLRRVDGHPLPPERDLRWGNSPGAGARRYAWKRWGIAPGTVRAIDRLEPALVHAHFGRDAAQLLPVLRRRRRPLVVTFHGHDILRGLDTFTGGSYTDRLYAERWKALVDLGSKFLAVSSVIRDRLLQRGVPAPKVELHYIGVDSERIARAGDEVRESDLVVFVGRLVPHKGGRDLVEAVALAKATGRPLRVVVIGAGPEGPTLQRRAAELGLDVKLLGPRPQEQVWSWMRRAAVVAVPSRTADDGWKEAFGLVAAEAQAAGARVVASTCGGLPEAVAPANEALLFPEGDVDALADRLIDATADRADTARLVAEAAAWIRLHRDLVRQSARLDDLYEEVAP